MINCNLMKFKSITDKVAFHYWYFWQILLNYFVLRNGEKVLVLVIIIVKMSNKNLFALCHVVQLLDIVYREETLFNVIRSVTKNGKSILLTAVLAVILIYLFSIVGFLFFQDDFLIEVDILPNKNKIEGLAK